MLGVGLCIGHQSARAWWLLKHPGAKRATDYQHGLYMSQGKAVSVGIVSTEARNTPQFVTDADGTMREVSALELAIGSGIGLGAYGQATNRARFSQVLGNSAWIKRGAISITDNALLAPDGTTTMTLVEDMTTAGLNDFYQNVHFASIAAGSRTEPSFHIRPITTTGTLNAVNPRSEIWGDWQIDLSLLTAGVTQRITKDHPAVTVATEFVTKDQPTVNCGILLNMASGTADMYVWGFQLEAGEFSSSYIPTTTAAVTRDAGNTTVVQGSGPIPFPGHTGTKHTRRIDWNANGVTGDRVHYTESKDANDYMQLHFVSGLLRLESFVGGVSQGFVTASGVDDGNAHTAVMYWDSGATTIKLSVDGAAADTDATVTLPTDLILIEEGHDSVADHIAGFVELTAQANGDQFDAWAGL